MPNFILVCLNFKVPGPYQALVNRFFQMEIAEDQNAGLIVPRTPAEGDDDNNFDTMSRGGNGNGWDDGRSESGDNGGGGSKDRVNFAVNFAPLRPFNCNCTLILSKVTGGGRWRFNLNLEAAEPEVDDIIEIESGLNRAASVAFRLSNNTSAYAEFDAFFDSESAGEFSVQPTSGVLEPAGSKSGGTMFIVTYRPTEYGKQVQGKLIIQTHDVVWSYLVKGSLPKYVAPVVTQPKVNTRLPRNLQAKLSHGADKPKNYIQSNISAARERASLGGKTGNLSPRNQVGAGSTIGGHSHSASMNDKGAIRSTRPPPTNRMQASSSMKTSSLSIETKRKK
jgi:hypothetical protein